MYADVIEMLIVRHLESVMDEKSAEQSKSGNF